MRSRSGTTNTFGSPYMSPDDTCRGIWSTVDRREDVPRAERVQQRAYPEQGPERVDVRVAEVDTDGVRPVFGDDGVEPAVDLGERLVPRRLDVAFAATDREVCAVGPDPRGAASSVEPFGQMNPCEKTSARSPRIRVDRIVSNGDLEAAGGLAQRARAELCDLHVATSAQLVRIAQARLPQQLISSGSRD